MQLHSLFIGLGYGSLIAHLFAFSSRSTHTMLKLNILSTFLLGLSMIPFGGYNGASMSFVSVFSKISGLLGYGTQIKESHKGVVGFMLGVGYFIFFNQEGWYGLLPALSMVFIVLADLQKNVITMKYYYYGSAICWLSYGVAIDSMAAILYDIIGIVALSYSLYQIKRTQNSRSDCAQVY